MTGCEIGPNVIAFSFSGDAANNECSGDDSVRHYFAHIDPNYDGRICIDCGEPEVEPELA